MACLFLLACPKDKKFMLLNSQNENFCSTGNIHRQNVDKMSRFEILGENNAEPQ